MKLKLTKEQRWVAYCIMLAEVNCTSTSFLPLGFCYFIKTLFDIEIDDDCKFGGLRKHFPELAAKRDFKDWRDIFLFKDWGSRARALKKCIQETHP